MAIISSCYKLLFLRNPRTGSASTGKAIINFLNGRYLLSEDIIDKESGHFKVNREHTFLDELIKYKVINEIQIKKLFVFSSVRNPFDSLVSLYLNKAQKNQHLVSDPSSWIYRIPNYVEDMRFCRNHSFDEWIFLRYGGGRLKWPIKKYLRWQRSLSGNYSKNANFIIRYENLQDDFDQAIRMAGIEKRVVIPEALPSIKEKRPYEEYYTKRSRKIVETIFKDELSLYGYKFGG